MARRFGRNQKRALLEQVQAKQCEVEKWAQHCSYAQNRLQEVVSKQQELIDVGLRIEQMAHYESRDMHVRVSLLDAHYSQDIDVRTTTLIRTSKSRDDFIKYVGEEIAHSLVKLIGDRIHYG